MYDQHVPTIAAAMRDNPETFARGCMFAILSIQQMVITVPQAMADVDKRKDRSQFLFGAKLPAYQYLQVNKVQLWRDTCAAETAEDAINILLHVPSLGIVKAGFVAQMMGFDVACLDTRNIQRENLNPEAYALHGRKHTPRAGRLVAQYVAQTGGRARELWDVWCADVANAYKRSAEAISALHLDVIVPPAMRLGIAPMACPIAGVENIPF